MAEPGTKRRKRGAHDGSYRLRSDGRWEVRITLPNGRSKSVYGKTRTEVQKKHRDLLKDLDDGLDRTGRPHSVAEFVHQWLTDVVSRTARPSTYRSYEQLLRVHVVPELGMIPLGSLSPAQVQRLLNQKSDAGLSPRTVSHIRAVLRTALNQALRWKLVTRNAAELATPPRMEKPERTPLSVEEAKLLLEQCSRHPLGPLFATALATGLRQGELLGLEWDDVDMASGTVTVRRALQRIKGELRFVETKSASSRRKIVVPEAALKALRDQHARQEALRLLAGDRWQANNLVFTTRLGTPLDGGNVTKQLQRLLREANLPHQRFHDLRHACASFLLAGGVPPRTIMGVLGHSQISLTLDTYAHLSPNLERDAADALDLLLAK